MNLDLDASDSDAGEDAGSDGAAIVFPDALIALNSSTAYALFEVFEEAYGIPRMLTDTGSITFSMVRTFSGWKIDSMTIWFGSYVVDAMALGESGTAFGLGRLPAQFRR
ncbi:MAG: hypothetical protein NUW23_03635 [Firmicutes bacterium]|nr:hypothetical protein [Bacillota bacterium]